MKSLGAKKCKNEERKKKIKEIFIKFWEDSTKDNPEGKTELINYDKWVDEIFRIKFISK